MVQKPILLIGKTGQLGSEICQLLGHTSSFVAVDRSQLDLANSEQIRDLIQQVQPSVVVNCAAYTAVDLAEDQEALAYQVNVEAVRVIAQECAKQQALFIHYSTDYLFDGSSKVPYVETDVPAPLNVYGKTKWLGEEAIREEHDKHLILRTSWVYGVSGKNFLKTILRLIDQKKPLRIVADQFGVPNYSRDLAIATVQILGKEIVEYGTYHLSSQGSTSWYEFAKEIANFSEKASSGLEGISVTPIRTEEYPLKAQRPAFSVLNSDKIDRVLGIRLPFWKESVSACLEELLLKV